MRPIRVLARARDNAAVAVLWVGLSAWALAFGVFLAYLFFVAIIWGSFTPPG